MALAIFWASHRKMITSTTADRATNGHEATKPAEHRCPAQCRQVVDQHVAERNDRAEVHTENHGVDQVEPDTTA